MNKNIAFIFCMLLLASTAACGGKNEQETISSANESKADYDTAAVDSFSPGALSIDVERQIRMSSKQYQDSLKEAVRLQQEEKKIAEELEKERKKKESDAKQKSDNPISSGKTSEENTKPE